MDPLSGGASVSQLIVTIASVAKFIHRIQKDVRNAKCEVLEAQKHVSLLQSEIECVRELKRCINDNENPFDLSAASIAEAISTAESLLLEIRHAFPSADSPERFRDKLRWALKDKLTVGALAAKLRETETSLQTILQLEQNRISRTMWSVLLRQSTSIDRIEKQQASNHEVIQTMIMNHQHPAGMTGMVQVDIESVNPEDDLEYLQLSKPLPQLDRPGFSAQLVIHPQGRRKSMTLRMTAFSKIYTASFKVFWPSLSLCVALRSQNIVPMNSAIIQACTTGNFKQARHLLANGSAQVSDMSSDHWPILDYAIQGGSCRIVQLLLDHGADPNMTYDQSSMSPIQSAFMHGRLGMARHLISAGADIDHVDRDGFSALSYLWVVDQPLDNSADFVRMCSAAEFDAVNAVDSRGWAPLHRAAAIGTVDDIDEFVKLGASTGLRTQWYGWTPLFFAASHDNVATFTSLVQHSQIDIRDYLDGDGWNLLHCAVYFGAPKIMRLLVGGGIDINLPTKPAPMLEDPELAYLELTARDLAIYMGPERYKMYTDALSHSGYEAVVDSWDDVFWDAEEACPDSSGACDVSTISSGSSVYGAEDVDDQWTILHWASYCGSEKVMRLLLMKGADPKYTAGITAYLPPSLDDIQQPQSPQYIHGSVARPFHGPSKALCEED